jgi:hypothetical protein
MLRFYLLTILFAVFCERSVLGLAGPQKSHLAQYTAPRQSLHEHIYDVIGKTPIIRLQRLAPDGVNVYVKVESVNPGGSLGDRVAYGTIEWAEQQGLLEPGQVRAVLNFHAGSKRFSCCNHKLKHL